MSKEVVRVVYFAPLAAHTFQVREALQEYVSPDPTSVPDPFDDADSLGELEEEIVILSAHLDAGEIHASQLS